MPYSAFTDFINDNYICSSKTDVFEESLLALAGIEEKPKHCRFWPYQKIGEQEFLCIRFIFSDNIDPNIISKIIAYLYSLDSSAPDTNNNALTTIPKNPVEYKLNDNQHFFTIYSRKIEENLYHAVIQYLKDAISTKQIFIKAYQEASINSFYPKLIEEKVNAKLKSHLICYHATSIFTKSLIDMSGISVKPQSCRLKPSDETGKVIISFNFGILQLSTVNKSGIFHYIKNTIDPDVAYQQDHDDHLFSVNYQRLCDNYIPIFLLYIDSLSTHFPEKYTIYQEKSKSNKDIKFFYQKQKINLLCDTIKKAIPNESHTIIDEFQNKFALLSSDKKEIDSFCSREFTKMSQTFSNYHALRNILREIHVMLLDMSRVNLYLIYKINEDFLKAKKIAAASSLISLISKHGIFNQDTFNHATVSLTIEKKSDELNKLESLIIAYLLDEKKETAKFGEQRKITYTHTTNEVVQKEARDIKIYAIAKEISKSPTFFSMTAQQKKDAFVEQLNKLGIEKFKTRKV